MYNVLPSTMTSKLLYSDMEVRLKLISPMANMPRLLTYLLTQGLNYANLPKILLKFHRYGDHCRTPLEEHLVEAAAYHRTGIRSPVST